MTLISIFSELPQWQLNQLMALFGSFLYICYLLLAFENKWNKDKRLKWSKYWKDNRFDFLILLITGQVLTVIQEFLFTPIPTFIDPDAWDWYYDIEEFISFGIGIFALHLLSKFLNMGRKKIDTL